MDLKAECGVITMEVDHETARKLLTARIEQFRTAYQDRDLDKVVALFAEQAEFTAAPGIFRGRAEIREFLAWDAGLSPSAAIRDAGIGVAVCDDTVVWERVIALTYKNAPYEERSVAVVDFDEDGLIRSFRSYYDKLDVLHQITSGLPGVSGWFSKKVVGSLVAAGSKGLTVTPHRRSALGSR